MLSRKRITIGAMFLALLCLFLFWPTNSGIDSSDHVAETQYPEAWKNLGVPGLPGAKVTDILGSRTDDGVEFELEIDQPAEQVGSFYEQHFLDRDFDYYVPNESNDGHYTNEFTNRSGLGVNIDVWPDPNLRGRSRVRIAINHDKPAPYRATNTSVRVD